MKTNLKVKIGQVYKEKFPTAAVLFSFGLSRKICYILA